MRTEIKLTAGDTWTGTAKITDIHPEELKIQSATVEAWHAGIPGGHETHEVQVTEDSSGPHLGNVSMQHLMRTSVLILAVMGRSDLVETALDEYKAKPLLPRNETPERFERFVEWLRMVPQDTWEELRR